MLIDINKIKVNDRIRKDFGNIEELAKDIEENGLINPPTVTPEFELIAGERRLRACKHLGYSQIEVRVMTVKDEEHQLKMEISENENRKEFTFSERVDWAKRLERIERIKARERQATLTGGANPQLRQNFGQAEKGKTDNIVAEQIGFGSGEQYRKAKFILDNADEELINQLDEKKISIHRAYVTLKEQLNEKENKLKELEESNNKLKQEKEKLDQLLTDERNKQPKIIDNTDYSLIDELSKKIKEKEKSYQLILNEKNAIESKMMLLESENEEFYNLKKQIENLSKEREDISRQIESATSISGLVVEIEHLIKENLAPVKYSKAIQEMSHDEIVIENLDSIINLVQSWCDEMKSYLPNKRKIINAEVI